MKKLLSLCLILTLAFGMLSIASVSAEYDFEDTLVSGNIKYEILEDGTAAFNGYTGDFEEFTVPSEIEGLKVTKIHRMAFAWKENLRSVTVPEGVTYIGFGAFDGCKKLEELILPDSLQHMHYMYIEDTKLYNDLNNWENGVLYIGKHLIDTNPKQISGTFTVKDGTVAITQLAFDSCKELTEVILPDSLKTIGDSAFRDCDKLSKINLTDNITFIDRSAFSDCPLEEVHIPAGLTRIEPYAFRGCAFEEITIPENIEYIGYDAFASCNNLTSVTIPQSVTYLGDSVFWGCEKLYDITFPENLEYLGDYMLNRTAYYNDENNWEDGLLYHGKYLLSADREKAVNCNIKEGTEMVAARTFYSCDKLVSVKLPDSVTYIGDQCFGSCYNLKSVRFSPNLKEIAPHAFLDCIALESVYIPEGVEAICEDAFFCCESLSYISIPSTVSTIDEYAVGYYNPYYDEGGVIMPPEKYPKNENLIIAGYKGTATEKYAKDNGFAFEDLDAPSLNKYKDRILEILEISENENDTTHLVKYKEVYGYSANDGQSTPDFVLINAYSNMFLEADFTYHFGDYVMYESSTYTPFELGYGVYLPQEDKLYSLVEAWEMGIENLDILFTKGFIGKLTGDVNFDGKLNIRDATLIQKHLAQMTSIYDYIEYNSYYRDTAYADRVADFNRDGKLSIRDATAIQKRLAGLDFDTVEYAVLDI